VPVENASLAAGRAGEDAGGTDDRASAGGHKGRPYGYSADVMPRSKTTSALPATLPDLLADGLAVVFVGINPSVYSVERGHYFARPGNRFWPAFSRSRLSEGVRRGLGVEALLPEHDRMLPARGFGFTDVVKRATPRATGLEVGELGGAAPALFAKLERHRPRVACFHGLTGFRPFRAAALGLPGDEARLGAQGEAIGATRLFVVPNPSGGNAHFTLAEQAAWYDRLAEFLEEP
jgi:TDG/mug DNA glycosylase family protein